MRKLTLLVILLMGTAVHAEEPKHAQAMLIPLGDSTVGGIIKFVESSSGGLEIMGQIVGLKPNSKHGFHVHEFGNCTTPDGSSAGGHFKVGTAHHGAPNASERHVGDLGNVSADKAGMALVNSTDKALSLTGPNSIIGRSVVVHDGEDDLKSDPAGNSGPRIACGVIGISK